MSKMKVTPVVLTTPCSLQALRQWLTKIDQVAAGDEYEVIISSTSSTVTAA